MHRGDPEFLKAIESAIPKAFFRDVLADLLAAHREACSFSENYSQPVAKDLFPQLRRALVEDKLPSTARKHDIIARSALNRAGNASHAELETMVGANRVVITTLAVPTFWDLTRLRSARFRKTLAEKQPWLFEEFRPIGDGYYGVILYNASRNNKNKLNFAYLAFPTADCRGWFGHYDVSELATTQSDVENIQDKANPKLRKHIKEKEE